MKLNYGSSSSHQSVSVPHQYQHIYPTNHSGTILLNSCRHKLARNCKTFNINSLFLRWCVYVPHELGSSPRRGPSVSRRPNSRSGDTHQHHSRRTPHHAGEKSSYLPILHHSVPSLHEYKVRLSKLISSKQFSTVCA